jgi:oligopeptide transport system permease protein
MSMLDALSDPHVQTAAAKGLSRWRVIWRHAFPIAFLPVLSWLGPATAQAVTGSFVVEKVFDLPGIGQHFVNSALNADRGLMLSTVLVLSAILVGFNLLVDVLYSLVDPRIRGAV